MEKVLLLPHRLKIVGWIIFVLSVILGFEQLFFNLLPDYSQHTQFILNDVAIIGITIGLILAGLSRKRIEDEYTTALRLDSLLKAVYASYAVLLFTSLLFYGMKFITVMFFLLFMVMIFYLIFFETRVMRGSKIDKPLLFPHKFKRIGLYIFIPAALLGIYLIISTFFVPEKLFNNIAIFANTAGILLLCFSKESVEDEYISRIRLNALHTALYFQYTLVIICTLVYINMDFVCRMFILFFTLPLIYYVIFRLKLHRLKNHTEISKHTK